MKKDGRLWYALAVKNEMKTYTFNINNAGLAEKIKAAITTVAANTETHDLVTAVYHIPHFLPSRGTACVGQWHEPKYLCSSRGYWSFTRDFSIPGDCPLQFKLIRIGIALNENNYPKTERDIYQWEFAYSTPVDHVALFFAHELHHFRKYHLGLHSKEGEHGANRWALKRARECGYDVQGRRLPVKPLKKSNKRIYKIFPDPYKSFRYLKPGEMIYILRDPKGRYQNQFAEIIRPVRSNSKRMVIKTSDNKTWRWPMQWLKIKK